MPDLSLHSQQLFYTIEVLDEAISKGRQVSFTYNSYGTDKKLHPRRDSAGNVREYIVNPYQIAAANGRYYLICNYDKYDNVAHYRLDRITNIKLLPIPAKPMEQVKGLEHGFDLPRHMAEHVYLFPGESGVVTFRAKKYCSTTSSTGSGAASPSLTRRGGSQRPGAGELRRHAPLGAAIRPAYKAPVAGIVVKQVGEDIRAAGVNYGE